MQNELYRLLIFENNEINSEILKWIDSKNNSNEFIINLLKDKMLSENTTKTRGSDRRRRVGINGEMSKYRK